MRSHRHIYPIYPMGGGLPFSPLDLNPVLALDTQPVLRADPSIPMMTVRREPEGDEVEIYGFNRLNPRQYKTSAGGAYVTDESLLFPTQRFYDVDWYDPSGNTNDAAQTTAASQPELIWEGATFGSELSSGTLTIGNDYEITAQTDADFTTDGAPDSLVGTIFRATGTNVTLDAGDKVKEVLTWGYPVLNFDGVDDVLVVANDATINFGTADYSIFTKILPLTVGGTIRILDKRDANGAYSLYQGLTGTITAYAYDGVTSVNAALVNIVDGVTWFNITSIADRDATIDMYNGVTKTSGEAMSGIGDMDSAALLYIGNLNQATAQWYKGKMKSVQLYKTVLTESQIAKLNAYYTP